MSKIEITANYFEMDFSNFSCKRVFHPKPRKVSISFQSDSVELCYWWRRLDKAGQQDLFRPEEGIWYLGEYIW